MKLPNFLCSKRRCELIRLGQPNNKNRKDEPIVFE